MGVRKVGNRVIGVVLGVRISRETVRDAVTRTREKKHLRIPTITQTRIEKVRSVTIRADFVCFGDSLVRAKLIAKHRKPRGEAISKRVGRDFSLWDWGVAYFFCGKDFRENFTQVARKKERAILSILRTLVIFSLFEEVTRINFLGGKSSVAEPASLTSESLLRGACFLSKKASTLASLGKREICTVFAKLTTERFPQNFPTKILLSTKVTVRVCFLAERREIS